MNIDPWILSFSAITVAVTIFMGFWSARRSKTASDFFVAGRSVSVGWNASAISGEYLSAASFMGVAGMVMSSGYDALWYPVCYACGYLFLLLFIAGPLRRFGAYTIPDFAEGRYDSPIFRKIAVIFVMFIGFFYTMPQMKGAGTTLAYIFPGLPYWVGVALVGAVITLNVALGGMKGITLVQAFQYWAKMFAISVPIFVLMSVYGHYGKQLEVNGKTSLAGAEQREQFAEMTFNPASDSVSEQLKTHLDWLETKYGKPGDLATGTFDVGEVLIELSLTERKPVLVQESLAKNPSFIATKVEITNATPGESRRTEILNILQSNKLGVIDASEAWILASSDQLAAFEHLYREQGVEAFKAQNIRKPLPEKAPADQKWISPFGPLTTKAIAKTAAGGKKELDWSKRSQLSDPLPFVQTKPNLLRDLDQFTEKFGSRPSRGFYIWNTNEPVWMVLSRLKAAAGVVDILCDTNLLLKTVKSDRNQELRTEEFVSFVEITLKAQGVSIVRASKQEWWVVPTAELTSYFKPFDTKPYALLYTYSLIIALVCGTAGLPHILVRFYTNPDGVAAKRTTMWVMILIGIFYVFPPVFGVIGRNLMPELYTGLAGIKGTDQVVLKLPMLLNERVPMLGSILSGITCAGAFAAFMSTFSGLLVSMTGALAHDVYGRILRPKSTPEQRMRMFKFGAVLIGAVAILLGMQVEQLEINFMVGQAFAIAAASYFPLLFMSVWWRGMTQKGAATGMLTGGLLALGGITLTSVSDIILKTSVTKGTPNPLQGLESFWIGHPAIRILCEQPAIWAVPLAITLMIVVSKLTRKEIPSDVRMKMLVLHAPEKLGLKQEYIQEHQGMSH